MYDTPEYCHVFITCTLLYILFLVILVAVLYHAVNFGTLLICTQGCCYIYVQFESAGPLGGCTLLYI